MPKLREKSASLQRLRAGSEIKRNKIKLISEFAIDAKLQGNYIRIRNYKKWQFSKWFLSLHYFKKISHTVPLSLLFALVCQWHYIASSLFLGRNHLFCSLLLKPNSNTIGIIHRFQLSSWYLWLALTYSHRFLHIQ